MLPKSGCSARRACVSSYQNRSTFVYPLEPTVKQAVLLEGCWDRRVRREEPRAQCACAVQNQNQSKR
jgi:hypothetical protein